MDGISLRISPGVLDFLIDDRIPALEIGWIFQERVVFIAYVLLCYLLLKNLLSPVIVQPWMIYFFLLRRSLE